MEASWCTWQTESRAGSGGADEGHVLPAGPQPRGGRRVPQGPAHHHVYGESVLGLEVLQPAQHGEHPLLPHLHCDQLLHQRRDL